MEDEYLDDDIQFEEEYDEDYNKEAEPEKKKRGLFSRVILFQTVVCVMFLASLGGLKIMLPDIYKDVSEQLRSALMGPEIKEGVKNILNQITIFIDSLTPIGRNDSKKEDSSQDIQQDTESDKAVEQQNVDSNSNLEEHKFIQPTNGPISSPFGERISPFDGTTVNYHYGVDIAVDDGTPVMAMTDGVVSTADFSQISGNFLSIVHADGYESLYAHCSEVLVETGSDVASGQIIALSGQTGLVTGSHLHFGVKKDGNWIDPVTLFPTLT